MGLRIVLPDCDCRITLRRFVSPLEVRFRSVGRLVGFSASYELHGVFCPQLMISRKVISVPWPQFPALI